jgi:hypothetical protein
VDDMDLLSKHIPEILAGKFSSVDGSGLIEEEMGGIIYSVQYYRQ